MALEKYSRILRNILAAIWRSASSSLRAHSSQDALIARLDAKSDSGLDSKLDAKLERSPSYIIRTFGEFEKNYEFLQMIRKSLPECRFKVTAIASAFEATGPANRPFQSLFRAFTTAPDMCVYFRKVFRKKTRNRKIQSEKPFLEELGKRCDNANNSRTFREMCSSAIAVSVLIESFG